MLATEATFVLTGPSGQREVTADGFFLGTYWTQLEADEILTEIRIPPFRPGTGYAYCKLKRKQGDWATAASAVVLELDGDACSRIGIGLTNVAETALKATDAENALRGKRIDEALIDEAARHVMAACSPAEDLRGDAEYKTHMAGEMTRRALRLALSRARGQ
jgi:carbon-monoxide dehydrogenase medium subunit